MEVKHCKRADREDIRNFLLQIKQTVDKGWPDDMVGVAAADQNAERSAQARQGRQRFIESTLRDSDQDTYSEGPRIFGGTSKCNLERFFNPFNQQKRILSSLY